MKLETSSAALFHSIHSGFDQNIKWDKVFFFFLFFIVFGMRRRRKKDFATEACWTRLLPDEKCLLRLIISKDFSAAWNLWTETIADGICYSHPFHDAIISAAFPKRISQKPAKWEVEVEITQPHQIDLREPPFFRCKWISKSVKFSNQHQRIVR